MPTDLPSLLVLVLTSAVTFGAARFLSRRFRAKRKDKEQVAQRAGESRQVRRARERRGR